MDYVEPSVCICVIIMFFFVFIDIKALWEHDEQLFPLFFITKWIFM
jgi:hypothetical protein